MRSNDKGDRYARTIEGSPHKFHISVSSLFIEQGWGSAHRCLCATYDGVVNILPQKMIYILRGIRSAFVLLLAWWFEIPWPVFSPAFSSFFFFFFLLWRYDTKYMESYSIFSCSREYLWWHRNPWSIIV